jgi:hypothetical protein
MIVLGRGYVFCVCVMSGWDRYLSETPISSALLLSHIREDISCCMENKDPAISANDVSDSSMPLSLSSGVRSIYTLSLLALLKCCF